MIIEYTSKHKMLSYMGVIQSVIESQYQVQYMKTSGEKIFKLKEGDCDVLSKNNIVSTIKTFKLNTRELYLGTILLKLGAYLEIIEG